MDFDHRPQLMWQNTTKYSGPDLSSLNKPDEDSLLMDNNAQDIGVFMSAMVSKTQQDLAWTLDDDEFQDTIKELKKEQEYEEESDTEADDMIHLAALGMHQHLLFDHTYDLGSLDDLNRDVQTIHAKSILGNEDKKPEEPEKLSEKIITSRIGDHDKSKFASPLTR